MNAAVISLGSVSCDWIIKEMENYFDKVDLIDIKYLEISFSGKKAEILYKGKPFGKYDCVHTLGSFRYANLLNALTIIMPDCVFMTKKASAYTVSHDKLLTQLALQKNNIPMPKTYVASTTEAARSIFGQVNYPIIMKFPQGTQGKGVLVAESFASASSIMDALSYLRQPFIIQEFIDTGGKDIRAFVVGDEVVASYQREAKQNEIRSNIHQGGTGKAIELDDESKKLAVKAAKSVGAKICGVDILMSVHKGPLVLEVNVSPGLQGITKYTGINVAEIIAKYLYEETRKLKDKENGEGMKDILSTLKKEEGEIASLITNLDFRSGRVLLSNLITKTAKLKEDDDYEIHIKDGEILIKRFKIN
ncbi:MAG: RimK family alpha-L-glutamate ligase [Candidatus Woesearchaeota archaeon]